MAGRSGSARVLELPSPLSRRTYEGRNGGATVMLAIESIAGLSCLSFHLTLISDPFGADTVRDRPGMVANGGQDHGDCGLIPTVCFTVDRHQIPFFELDRDKDVDGGHDGEEKM